ncbi:hypothetical protein MKW92_048702 [Papaver armeniacum]|nr:hypothetical protein MKW92_048702 [Papaver armeniacum]
MVMYTTSLGVHTSVSVCDFAGNIVAAAESTYNLQRKLVKHAESRDTSGGVQSS